MIPDLTASEPPTLRVAHLVGDENWGGVTRSLAFLSQAPALARHARHSIVPVRPGTSQMPDIEADVIVSHLAVNWRNLPQLTALRARYPNLPLAHVEHSYTEGFVAGNVANRLRFHSLLRAVYALFDEIAAVSSAQAELIATRGLAPRERVSLLRSCAGIGDFLALPQAAGAVRHFAAIGRFVPQKGFDMLIPAFRAVTRPDVTLTFVGDGEMRETLADLARGDARIRFSGYSDTPATVLERFDAVLMPSRYEACGLVALEAMAAGRSVLVSGVDGLADHVACGASLCSGHSVANWTAAIEAMAATDPHEAAARRQAARAAVALAEQEFARAYDRLLSRLTGGDRRSLRAA